MSTSVVFSLFSLVCYWYYTLASYFLLTHPFTGTIQEGRKIWENILSVSRNMSRMIQLYGEEVGPENHKRITNLVAAYPYLLRQHIRPGCLCNPNDVVHEIPMQHRLLLHQQGYQRQETRHEGQESSSSSSNSRTSVSVFSTRDMTSPDETPENNLSSSATTAANSEDTNSPSSSLPLSLDCWVDKRELPWSLFLPQSLPAIARTENRPLWVCDRMAALICQIPYGPNFTSRERLCLLGMVDKLTNAVGQCERIHQTAVPLNYARHSLRSLTLWLFTLPFCLVQDFGIWFTAPANAAIAWLFFGVYQIGYSIEDPFQGSLRLSILCDAIRRSVIRQSTEQYGDDMKSEGDDRVALLSPPTSPLLEVSDPRATFSLTVPPSSSLFGHPPASASESTSRIVNAIRTRRQQQEDEKRRDSSAASPDNLDEIDTTITVDELRPEETMARVTEDMTKTLQEQIQQQLDLPTPKNVPSSLPTSEAAALVSSTSKSTIEQQNSSSHRTFAEPLPQTSPETSSSSKGLLIPKTGVDQSVFNMSTDYDLSLSPPPTLSSPHPLWIIDEELLQAPKIVRHHPNGTCTEIDI